MPKLLCGIYACQGGPINEALQYGYNPILAWLSKEEVYEHNFYSCTKARNYYMYRTQPCTFLKAGLSTVNRLVVKLIHNVGDSNDKRIKEPLLESHTSNIIILHNTVHYIITRIKLLCMSIDTCMQVYVIVQSINKINN